MKKAIVASLLMVLLLLVGCVNDAGQWIDEQGNLFSIGVTSNTTLVGLLKGNGSSITAVAAPSGTVVGTTDAQTLSNKKIEGPDFNSTELHNIYSANVINGGLVRAYTTNSFIGISGGLGTSSGGTILLSGYQRASPYGGSISFYTTTTAGSGIARLRIYGETSIVNAIFTSCNISIGGQTGHLLAMEASGGGYYDTSTHAFVDVSSSDYKTNLHGLNNATAILRQLQPVTFDWLTYIPPVVNETKDANDEVISTEIIKAGYWTEGGLKNQYGLIAQDAFSIDPALASVTNGKPTGLNTNALIAVLTQVLKEQDARITGLEKKINELESR